MKEARKSATNPAAGALERAGQAARDTEGLSAVDGRTHSPLCAQSSNQHPHTPREEVVACAMPGGTSPRGPAVIECWRKPRVQHLGNSNRVLAASHLLLSCWFGKVPEIYHCKDDHGILQRHLSLNPHVQHTSLAPVKTEANVSTSLSLQVRYYHIIREITTTSK